MFKTTFHPFFSFHKRYNDEVFSCLLPLKLTTLYNIKKNHIGKNVLTKSA